MLTESWYDVSYVPFIRRPTREELPGLGVPIRASPRRGEPAALAPGRRRRREGGAGVLGLH